VTPAEHTDSFLIIYNFTGFARGFAKKGEITSK